MVKKKPKNKGRSRVARAKPSISDRISAKFKKIMAEGIRRNTHRPVSKSNPRRPVSRRQALAVAENIVRRGKD